MGINYHFKVGDYQNREDRKNLGGGWYPSANCASDGTVIWEKYFSHWLESIRKAVVKVNDKKERKIWNMPLTNFYLKFT